MLPNLQLTKTIFSRTVRGRCPRCGRGNISEKGFRYRSACENCNYVFARDRVDLEMFLYVSTAAITGIFVMGYLIIGFPTTGWYRLWVALGGLLIMIATSPLRRFLGIGFLYLSHLLFDEDEEKTRFIDDNLAS